MDVNMAAKKTTTSTTTKTATTPISLEQQETKVFSLESQLLEDFRLAFSDTTGVSVKPLKMETSLFHELNINSLSFLESLQIVTEKYEVDVYTEELQGILFVGRVVNIVREKIIAKHGSEASILESLANRSLNLVANDAMPAPRLITKMLIQKEENKSKKRR